MRLHLRSGVPSRFDDPGKMYPDMIRSGTGGSQVDGRMETGCKDMLVTSQA